MNISKEFLEYSRNTGNSGETDFTNEARKRGFIVTKSNDTENMHSHIDFFITKNNTKSSVDVKGLKDSITEGEVWIEFKNVRGDRGWLYGSSDFIAFQITEGFVLVNRKSLIEVVEAKTNFNAYADKEHAKYKLYSRAGRKDELTKIDVTDLFECKHKKWFN